MSWIDSKAMFGDRETVLSDVSLQVRHRKDETPAESPRLRGVLPAAYSFPRVGVVLPSQVTSYVNRFGPGMVIFWLGVEGPVPCPSKDVLVVDRFPEQVLLPDGRVVDTCQAATSS